MRRDIAGWLLLVVSFLGPFVWDRFMNTAPEVYSRIVFYAFGLFGVALILLSDPIYGRLVAAQQNRAVSSVIAALAAALVVGSAWWFFVASRPENPRLECLVTTTSAEHPSGTTLAGIRWRSPYVELRAIIINPTSYIYEDVDIILRPNSLVSAIGQASNIPDVIFNPVSNPTMQMELNRTDGGRNFIPLILIASDIGYRVQCPRLPSKTHLDIIMATVTMAANIDPDPPVEKVLDRSFLFHLNSTASDGRKSALWYGYADRPDAIHGEKTPATTLEVTGSYIAGNRAQAISETFQVTDVIGNAAKKIRQDIASPSKRVQ